MRDQDVRVATTLPEVEGDEEVLQEDWDSIQLE